MFEGKLNQFCTDVNNVVVGKGFWTDMHTAIDDIKWLEAELGVSPEMENEWFDKIKATKNAFISQKIALIMGECAEALEAMRKDSYGLEVKDSFEDEMADAFIRLSDLCGELNIDIEKQIEWKLNFNKSRPALHGKNF